MNKEYPFNLLTEYMIKGYQIDTSKSYVIEKIKARELIVPQRIDIIAKWLYIDAYVHNEDKKEAVELYRAHLDAFSCGNFIEPGSEYKNSLEKYMQVFDKLIENIRYQGFDEKKSIIPVGKNGEILDGSHRVAIAAYFDMEITIIRFPECEQNFGTDFFRNNLLNSEYLNKMVQQYLMLKENCYFACLWPVSYDMTKLDVIKRIISKFGRIIYIEELVLNYNGLKNFMSQIYGHQSWVGTYENCFSGVEGKVKPCFVKGKPIRTIVFEAHCLDDVLHIKKEIRDLYTLQNHSVHISDNIVESRQMADLLYNKNSLHHLNYGKPCTFVSVQKELDEIKSIIKQKNIKSDSIVIGCDGTMAIYGLGKCCNITEISIGNQRLSIQELKTENGIAEYSWGDCAVNDLNKSVKNYFVYRGVKFSALSRALERESIDKTKKKIIQKCLKKGKDISFFSEERMLKFERKNKMYGMGLLSKWDYMKLKLKFLVYK